MIRKSIFLLLGLILTGATVQGFMPKSVVKAQFALNLYSEGSEATAPALSIPVSTTTTNNNVVKFRRDYPKALDLIGNTPLCDITNICIPKNPGTRILGKCEFFNPGYSMKDRIIKNIFEAAEESGELKPGMTVVAASSGNTGCSVALMCAIKGYKAIVITNAKCSEEKCASIRAYGAELLIAEKGQDYMQMELDMADKDPNLYSVNQYNNLDNPGAHYQSTGPEIWAQTHGEITNFVAAGSTGGTISGIGGFLKSQNPNVRVTLADPRGSIFANFKATGVVKKGTPFLVEGVGKENIPGAMNFAVIDDTLTVTDKEAFTMCRTIASNTGLMVGGSSGLNAFAAAKLAEESEEPITIVTMLCDLGVKYLSKVYNEEYLEENDLK